MSEWLDEIFAALERVSAERAAAGPASARPTVFRGAQQREPAVDVSSAEVTLVLSTDPFAGELTMTRATLTNLTLGDRLGRLGPDGHTYADVALVVVDPSARAAARRLFAREDLALRWVLADGTWFEADRPAGALSVASAAELQWTVRLPAAWLERDRSSGELLADTAELAFSASASSS